MSHRSRRSGSVAIPKQRRLRTGFNDTLVSLPAQKTHPVIALALRALMALVLVFIVVAIVYLDKDAYTDNHDRKVSLIDAIYYATVTITTTGYGDITPVAQHARIINAIVVTPLRIGFLVLLVGTTLEVLANEGRRIMLDGRWRKRMRNHVVVVGYGTKGRSAVETLETSGVNPAQIVIIDGRSSAISDANLRGFAAIEGDATRRDILRRAEIIKAREVIITLDRDDSAILVMLTVRQLNPSAHVVVAVREEDNASLLRQSGADAVVTSSEAVGRLLGLSTLSPTLGSVMEDLLTYGEGLEVAERELLVTEVGKQPQSLPDQVIAVVRDEKVYRYFDPVVTLLARGDRLIVVRPAKELPWAPRPGTHDEDFASDDD